MTFGEMIEELRAQHAPRGTTDIVILRPDGPGFLECQSAEIAACLDELAQLPLTGEKASPLQGLAIRLLVGDKALSPKVRPEIVRHKVLTTVIGDRS